MMNISPKTILEEKFRHTYLKEFSRANLERYSYVPFLMEMEVIAGTGIWYWDIENNIQYWSEGFYQFMNINKSEIDPFELSKIAYANVHPEDLEDLCSARLKVIHEKKSHSHTYRVFKQDGSVRYVKSQMSVKLDEKGDLKFIVGFELDDTITQNAILELKEFKKNVTANEIFLGIGTWEYNIKTKKIVISDSLKKLLNYPENREYDEVSLDSWTERHLLPSDKDRFNEIYTNLRKRDFDVINRLILRDFIGNEIIVMLQFKVMRNEKGFPIKIVGTLKDVSDLEQSERKLELMVEELNRSNRELEEFAYIASHDLQEPIRKLITFSERINTLFANEIPASANIYLEKISKAAINMKHLIENLLEFSRVTRTKTTFIYTDLNELLNEVLQDFELLIEENNITVVASDLPTMDIVPHQMKQLFLNLIGNAIKFRKKDVPLKIEISHRDASLQEIKSKNLTPKSHYLIIEVKDNGIGFEQEYEEKVFQVFQRLNGKAEYPGTGIGLSICRKVMNFHNGLITVQSELGVGSTFQLILPYAQKK